MVPVEEETAREKEKGRTKNYSEGEREQERVERNRKKEKERRQRDRASYGVHKTTRKDISSNPAAAHGTGSANIANLPSLSFNLRVCLCFSAISLARARAPVHWRDLCHFYFLSPNLIGRFSMCSSLWRVHKRERKKSPVAVHCECNQHQFLPLFLLRPSPPAPSPPSACFTLYFALSLSIRNSLTVLYSPFPSAIANAYSTNDAFWIFTLKYSFFLSVFFAHYPLNSPSLSPFITRSVVTSLFPFKR